MGTNVEIPRDTFSGLEKQLEEDTSTQEENTRLFAGAIKDYNPVHFCLEIAKRFNLTGRPIHGTLLSSANERVERNTERVLLRYGNSGYLSKRRTDFKKPIYQGEKINCKIDGTNNGTLRTITSFCDDSVRITSEFTSQAPVQSHLDSTILYRHTLEFDLDDIADFFQATGRFFEDEYSYSQAEAAGTSAAVTFLEELNKNAKRSDDPYYAMNRRMETVFYDELMPGFVEIVIKEGKDEKELRKGMWIYNFVIETSQEGKPLATTDLTCVTNGHLDVHAFASQYSN